MEKKNILIIIPFLPYPMETGGHQALFNGIAAIKDDLNTFVAYEVVDDAAGRQAEKDFKDKLPGVTLLPLKKPEWIAPSILVRMVHGLTRILNKFVDDKTEPKEDDIASLAWWKKTVTPCHKPFLEHISKIVVQYRFDLIQVEMPWRISDIFILPDNAKRIFVHHELGFVRRELESKDMSNSGAYAQTVRRFADFNEINQLNCYDAVITLSAIDAQKLNEKGVTKAVYPSFAVIGTPLVVEHKIGDGKRLTFIGPDHHIPNLVGITWFLENCWSRLLKEDPTITLDIIGKWKEERKQDFSQKYPGVRFLGFVDDLNAAIQGSTMIVPITIGSGIRMKILEASSNGVPFVSTTVGAEGIPVTDGKDCFLADEPETFVQNVLKLQDVNLRQTFVKNAHQMVKTNYSLSALRKNRLDIYNKILNS